MNVQAHQNLDAAINAFREKKSFEKELKQYEALSLFRRLTVRRPVDPLPGVDSNELRKLTTFAFERAYPELNSYYIGSDGKRVNMKTELNFVDDKKLQMVSTVSEPDERRLKREFFNQVEGKGFVFGYSDGADSTKTWKDSVYAEDYARSHRRDGGIYDELYNSLDCAYKDEVFISSDVAQSDYASLSSNEKQGMIAKLKEDFGKYQESFDKISEEVGLTKLAETGCKVNSICDFVDNRLGMNICWPVHAYDSSPSVIRQHELCNAKMYGMLADANMAVTPKELFTMAVSPQIPFPLGFHEIMNFSQKESYYANKGEVDVRQMLDKFVVHSLQEGYGIKSIRDYADDYLVKHNLDFDSFRPAYDKIEQLVAGNYYTALIEQTDTAYGKGICNVHDIEIQTPDGHFRQSISKVSDMECAETFLKENHGKDGNSYTLAHSIYFSDVPLDIPSVSYLSNIPQGELKQQFNVVASEEYMNHSSIDSKEKTSLCSGAAVLRDDIEKTVQRLLADGTYDSKCLAGQMLNDAGVRCEPGVSAHESIAKAASIMYGAGMLTDVARCNTFRSVYATHIDVTRKQLSAAAKQLPVKHDVKAGMMKKKF